MIKKQSVFYSTRVQDRMEKDETFRLSFALRCALQIASEIVLLYLQGTSPHRYCEKNPHPLTRKIDGTVKYFHPGSAEHEGLFRACREATRIETHLVFEREDVLSVNVEFFRSGRRYRIYCLMVTFPLSGEEAYISGNAQNFGFPE